ncbi:MAG: thioredoxin fold domain-containing protein, partial [Candidatus Hodarchaeales archaeon]
MANTLFHPTKDTWMTSFKENKPIIFLFQDKLCPACYSFEQTVLSDSEVQEYLFTNFFPLHIDINRFPDLYERFAGDEFLVHTIQAINGNLLGSCNNLSVSYFLNNLHQYKQLYPQLQDLYQDVLSLQDFSPLIQEEAKRFHEKIDLISEITLSALLNTYDSMY